jgi:streptomycin 6-kinase
MREPDLRLHRTLIENQERYHGDAGRRWLASLPGLVGEIAALWELTLKPPFTTGLVDYVTPVTRADGSAAVLKLCFIDPEFSSGVAALRAFDGHAAVHLLDLDLARGALLLERLEAGQPLSSLANDSAEMHVAAEVMRGLWQAPITDPALPRFEEWVADANEQTALPLRKRELPWIEGALRHAAELLQEPAQGVLLHGDLHHDNILSSQRGWLAIDPKGLVGDPAWELAPLLFNNLATAGDAWRPLLRRRLDQLIDELSLDRKRAYALSAVRSLQARFWSLRDDSQASDGIAERAFHVAEELARPP